MEVVMALHSLPSGILGRLTGLGLILDKGLLLAYLLRLIKWVIEY